MDAMRGAFRKLMSLNGRVGSAQKLADADQAAALERKAFDLDRSGRQAQGQRADGADGLPARGRRADSAGGRRMTWCRIIDADGEQYLCVLAPSDQRPAILTSWCSGGRMTTAVLPTGGVQVMRTLRSFCRHEARERADAAQEH